MKIGLRVDVDTFRGARLGVPSLCRVLASRGILATFFWTVGPDNMGRHLWRLLRPSFLWKMLRSNAPGLYGWDILLRGTLWPGPIIGRTLAPVLRETAATGHEMGFHAWDHHAWQSRVELWSRDAIYDQIVRGVDLMTEIIGRQPTCSAAPAWQCTDLALWVKAQFPFSYNSDCRGSSIFLPEARDSSPVQPQIPVTLPTFDEAVGINHQTAEGFFDDLLTMLEPGKLNVLTIHAEVEGLSQLETFERFIDRAMTDGWSFVPLGDLVEADANLPSGRLKKGSIPGRAGWCSVQDCP